MPDVPDMPDPLLWPEPTATLIRIARVAGVGRAAVTNWRRHHPDFPAPVGGTDQSPQFPPADAEAWLHRHGKISRHQPETALGPTATLTLPDGQTITLKDAHLRHDDGLVTLTGCTSRAAWARVPLQNAVLTRVQMPGRPDVTVTSANADVFDYEGTRTISLIWHERNEHPLPPDTTPGK
ncbi:hypothetical protein ACFVXH_39905 [Kitasatospora sp. NPDC058184]|uniref:hypothetical protein n=1 Tax=Kitasatospora sp. NPDC058184 TaxID=3346370 RepID=UPI0036DD1F96